MQMQATTQLPANSWLEIFCGVFLESLQEISLFEQSGSGKGIISHLLLIVVKSGLDLIDLAGQLQECAAAADHNALLHRSLCIIQGLYSGSFDFY